MISNRILLFFIAAVDDMWNLTLENTAKSDIKNFLTGSATEEKDGLIIEGSGRSKKHFWSR